MPIRLSSHSITDPRSSTISIFTVLSNIFTPAPPRPTRSCFVRSDRNDATEGMQAAPVRVGVQSISARYKAEMPNPCRGVAWRCTRRSLSTTFTMC